MGLRQVRCQSGLMGFRTRLRENYEGNYKSLVYYDEMYGIVGRLGYEPTREGRKQAWRENPVIEGSVIPSDFRKVRS